MAAELSEEDKRKLAAEAHGLLQPIAEKYEFDNKLGMEALFEAFQAGIRFTIHETKKAQRGQAQAPPERDPGF